MGKLFPAARLMGVFRFESLEIWQRGAALWFIERFWGDA